MNDIFSIILFFGSPEFVIIVSIIGLYFGERQIFLNTLLIAFMGMTFNAYLKSVFQIPLNPEIGKTGWAYPSGHSMFDVVFWGSLFIQFRKPWVLIVGLCLSILGFFGMVYKHYHGWIEIIGGICSGGLVLVAFYYWLKYNSSKVMLLSLVALAIELAIYNLLLPHDLMSYKWIRMIIGINIGICLALPIFANIIPHKTYSKAVAFAIATASAYFLRSYLPGNDYIIGAMTSVTTLILAPGIMKYIESKLDTKFRSA